MLGSAKSQNGRFPLLVKILDARRNFRASPSARDNKPPSLRRAEDRDVVHRRCSPARNVCRIETRCHACGFGARSGDARGGMLSSPRGEARRCHVLPSVAFTRSARQFIFEIQQTRHHLRVFDWNRVGFDGKPAICTGRQSLASIDFNDFEPAVESKASR